MATVATPPPSGGAPAPQQQPPWPLFDLCLDVPHPACSKSCPPPFLIASPSPQSAAITKELEQSLPQISRFCFAEFDESLPQPSGYRDAYLNQYDQYCLQAVSSHFTFSLQLASGVRVYGHVRRYLPPHLVARTRYDVGRRGPRALCLLTRASGADALCTAILKSVEAISSQQAALAPELQAHAEPQKWFLHQLSRHQEHLAQHYATRPPQELGKPLIAALEGLELGPTSVPKGVDTSRFIMPVSLLQSQGTAASGSNGSSSSLLLPLLRCVGVAHALRIMAALLSERRVVMVSHSPTRLASCSHAALSMLAQGMLQWQHLYIPVLPPHLWQYLAAPYPYLIGILSHQQGRLDQTDGLGEVLLIQLDSNRMETRGMATQTILQRLPDLFQQLDPASVAQSVATTTYSSTGVANPAANLSASELLAQDLVELLKTDKRTLYGGSESQLVANVSETAAKAGKALKGTFFKLRDKGRQYLQQRSGSENDQTIPEPPSDEPGDQGKSMTTTDDITTEGCHNEVCEEEARIAFCSFFLCLFGNMRWYLTVTNNPGHVPQLDRDRYLQQRQAMGDGEGTPMGALLVNFCQTQMLEEFAKARVEEVRSGKPVAADDALFLKCASYHRQHNLDFGVVTVRRIARQIADGSPTRLAGMLQTNARRMAMTLTSNKTYEGDYGKAVAQLVEQSRESSCVLSDVMSVVWLRLRDCKGMQWKHGYHALQLLRNLLYHGPLAVIAEATDGLGTIRQLKFYENMRSQNAQQIRTAASNVYNLLVDRARLFNIRRVCADRRRVLQDPKRPKLQRDRRLTFSLPFRSMHMAMHPQAAGTVARIPAAAPSSAPVPQTMQRGSAEELFGMASPPPAAQQQVQQAPSQAAADMLGLFDNMVVSGGTTPAPATPVAAAQPAPAAPSVPTQPTMVALPPASAQTATAYPNQPVRQPPPQAVQSQQAPVAQPQAALSPPYPQQGAVPQQPVGQPAYPNQAQLSPTGQPAAVQSSGQQPAYPSQTPAQPVQAPSQPAQPYQARQPQAPYQYGQQQAPAQQMQPTQQRVPAPGPAVQQQGQVPPAQFAQAPAYQQPPGQPPAPYGQAPLQQAPGQAPPPQYAHPGYSQQGTPQYPTQQMAQGQRPPPPQQQQQQQQQPPSHHRPPAQFDPFADPFA